MSNAEGQHPIPARTRRNLRVGVAALAARATATASRALGYAQVLGLLDGRWDEAEARSSTVVATRRFARRQRAWFRRDPRISWLDPDRDLLEQALAAL